MSGVKKAAAFAAARKNQMGNLQSAWLRRLFFRAATCSLTLEELDAFHNGDHTHGQSHGNSIFRRADVRKAERVRNAGQVDDAGRQHKAEQHGAPAPCCESRA